jgi:hypothetical protein
MTNPSSEISLTRRLVVAGKRGQEPRECLLEIRFDPASRSIGSQPAQAAFRITPFDDWRSIYGEDLIQALELTIRMAQSEAHGWGADWPDED